MKYLDYTEITAICKQINEKHIPNEDAFEEKLDELFENDQLDSSEFLQHSFKELLKVADAEMTTIEDKVNIAATCQQGCAHCCYFPIITTSLEAKLMLAEINNLPEERNTYITNHLHKYLEVNKQKIQKLCSMDFEKETDFKYNYIKEQLPCPFLDTSTNMCLAYEVRPIPCRTYLNYSDPSVCSNSFMPKEPFSYEFIHGFYMDALNEIVQAVVYEDDEVNIDYPNDIFRVDYLPLLIREALK